MIKEPEETNDENTSKSESFVYKCMFISYIQQSKLSLPQEQNKNI